MATAAQTLTTRDRFGIRLAGDFAQRSPQLARAAHLDGTARLEAMHERTLDFTVPSKDHSTEYAVTADYSGAVWCTCRAGEHNHSCSHAGAVFHALRQMHQATANYAN
jgi:hypothetical protein